MKKTYISPELLVVQMRPLSAVLQTSVIGLNSDETLDDSEDILVKGSVVTDVNVWDSTW